MASLLPGANLKLTKGSRRRKFLFHSLGGGRDALPGGFLDGEISCHYRNFPLLYARESDRVIETLDTVAAPNNHDGSLC